MPDENKVTAHGARQFAVRDTTLAANRQPPPVF
jgi:hypothetical protein